jgi:Ca-activated chloride channel family protein
MALGLKEGLSQVSLRLQPEAQISRIILLTDGEATDNENDSRRLAEQAAAKGIPIICLGFGKDWKHDFLIDLADRSIGMPGTQSGYADYIPDPGQVQRIFQEVYRSMQVVARDATLTMRLALGVEARRVWQAAPLIREIGASAIQGRAVVIPMSGGRAGDLEAGGSAYLAEITLPPRPAGAVRVAQCDLTYTLPGGAPQRQSVDLVVHYTPDLDATRQVNGQVMAVVEKVQAFKLQTQALSEAEMGNLPGATQKLRQAVTILLSQGETELAGQMEQEAERLEQGGQISDEGKKTIKLTSRKTVRLSGGEG